MARKINTTKKTTEISSKSTVTPVRNTAVPKVAKPVVAAGKVITREAIAKRAYEIFASGKGGTEAENWLRAERELRGL